MNRNDLSLLFSRVHSTQRSVLSVYLNIDQSQRINLNRGFEAQLKKMAAAARRTLVDVADRDRFAAAIHHVQDFVAAYSPGAKALALFYDTTDGFFWHWELEFAVTDQVRWDYELFLQPLASAMDQLEGCGVALAARAKLRLFSVAFGKIEEIVHEELDKKGVRHLKTVGTDQADSSDHRQRKADNQIRSNLRQAVKEMEKLAKSRKLHRFVLAGTPEITAELRSMLPTRLALNVIGEADIASTATKAEILAVVQPISEKYERDTEVEKVRNIVTSAAKNGKAVVGLGRTLKAVNAGRVWELVYSGGFLSPGYECPKCSALFTTRATRCPYCSSRILAVSNVVERAVEHVVRRNAKVEVVTGEASATLKAAGSIGAFLKTRTGTIET